MPGALVAAQRLGAHAGGIGGVRNDQRASLNSDRAILEAGTRTRPRPQITCMTIVKPRHDPCFVAGWEAFLQQLGRLATASHKRAPAPRHEPGPAP